MPAGESTGFFETLKRLLLFTAPWQTRPRRLKGFDPSLSAGRRAYEVARPWLLLALYFACAWRGWWLLAVPAAFATCLAAFVQMHDVVHDALGLPKWLNRLLLTASATLILKSGHALKATHLRHHGKCLAPDDPEGIAATWPLWKVLLQGPFHMLGARLTSLQLAPRTRRAQLLETGLTLLLVGLAIAAYAAYGVLAGLVYWGVVAMLSATIPLWASYIPHRIGERHPALLITSHATRAWTPILNSFSYHELHHAYPKVPTALLPALARHLAAEQASSETADAVAP